MKRQKSKLSLGVGDHLCPCAATEFSCSGKWPGSCLSVFQGTGKTGPWEEVPLGRSVEFLCYLWSPILLTLRGSLPEKIFVCFCVFFFFLKKTKRLGRGYLKWLNHTKWFKAACEAHPTQLIGNGEPPASSQQFYLSNVKTETHYFLKAWLEELIWPSVQKKPEVRRCQSVAWANWEGKHG